MSEALISKEHFYLNASQYNSGTSDVTANIHEDTQDILAQNADLRSGVVLVQNERLFDSHIVI